MWQIKLEKLEGWQTICMASDSGALDSTCVSRCQTTEPYRPIIHHQHIILSVCPNFLSVCPNFLSVCPIFWRYGISRWESSLSITIRWATLASNSDYWEMNLCFKGFQPCEPSSNHSMNFIWLLSGRLCLFSYSITVIHSCLSKASNCRRCDCIQCTHKGSYYQNYVTDTSFMQIIFIV